MKKSNKTLITIMALAFLSSCAQKQKPYTLYKDATGDTAKIRVIGFTDDTTIHQILFCTESSDLGYLRDKHYEERNPPRVVDKGFKKSVPTPENMPLDYQERLIPAKGWIEVRSALFASDGGLCTLGTHWFKPEKGALYEVRNRLNKAGNICSMKLVQINQNNGHAEKVETHERLAEFLPCQTIEK